MAQSGQSSQVDTTAHCHSRHAVAFTQPGDMSCVLEAEEVDLLRRYQHDNPRFVSFVNSDTRTRPIEEQIAESDLETKVHNVNSRVNARRVQLLRSLGTQPLPVLPTVPHTFELRKQRDSIFRAALTVQQQEAFTPLGDRLIKEVALTEEPRTALPHVVADLLSFYRERVVELPRKQLRYLERWATFGVRAPAAVQAQQLPSLQKKIAFLAEETAFCRDALSRLETFEQHLHSQARRNDGGPNTTHQPGSAAAAASSAREFDEEARSHAASAGGSVLDEVRADDLRVYFNAESSRLQLRRRFDRFSSQAEVMVMAKRYALYEATVQMLAVGHERAQDGTEGNVPPVFAAASGMPTLAADDASVLAHLEDMAGCFKLTGHDRSDIQEFVYNVNKKYTAVFAAQSESWSFAPPPAVSEALQSGAAADAGDDEKAPSGPYLKPTTWEDSLTVEAEDPEWMSTQRAMLSSVGRPHEALQAECAFLNETDILKTQARWREVAAQHMQRATGRAKLAAAAADGNVEAAAAALGHQPAKGGGPAQPPSMTTQRLNVLYQLRYLRIRELRRKMISGLNYFASVHRKISLDCRSWSFPAAATNESPGLTHADGLIPTGAGQSEVDVNEAARRHFEGCVVDTAEDRVAVETMAKKLLAALDAGTDAAVAPNARQAQDSALQFVHLCAGDGYNAGGTPNQPNSNIEITDSAGRPVMYQWALDQLEAIEADALRIATFFLARYGDATHGNDTAGEPDYMAVLEDVFESEAFFLESRVKVLDAYREAYCHCTDRVQQTQLAQRMLALIARRPRIDFEDGYFTASYTNEHLKLELEYTLLREMLSSIVADARSLHTRCGAALPTGKEMAALSVEGSARFGFPDGRMAADAAGYVPLLPNTTVVGILELLPGLDQIASVQTLLSNASRDVLGRFNLQGHVAAHHFMEKALLEEFLVSWRLLGEEERIARQSHHGFSAASSNAAQSPARGKPVTGTTNAPADSQDHHFCVLDDLSLVGEVVADCSDDAAFQALGTSNAPSLPGASLGRSKTGDGSGALALAPELKPAAKACATAIEALHVRTWLVSALYRTELLYNVHRLYGQGMGVSVKRSQLDTIDFDSRRALAEVDAVESSPGHDGSANPLLSADGKGPSTASLVVPFDCEFLPHLAIGELDQAMAKFDFTNAAGLKKVLSFGLADLRRALTIQVTQQNVLQSIVLCNQTSLDSHIEALLRQRWLRQWRGKSTSDAGKAAVQWQSRITTWPAPEAGDDVVDRLTLQRMYVSVNQVKSVHRKCLLAEMASRTAEGLDSRKPETLRRMMRQLKEQLLTEYSTNLLAATYQYAARAECAGLSARLRHIALGQQSQSIFTIGTKSDPVRPQPRTTQAAQGDGRRASTCCMARNGRLEDPRYIPHVCQLATFDLEPVAQQTGAAASTKNARFNALEAGVTRPHEHVHVHHQSHGATNFGLVQMSAIMYHWLAIHSLALAAVSASLPLTTVLQGNENAEFSDAWREVVVKVSAEIDTGLRDPTDVVAVLALLSDRHAALFLKLYLAGSALSQKLASDGAPNIAASIAVEVKRFMANGRMDSGAGSNSPVAGAISSPPWLTLRKLRSVVVNQSAEDRFTPSTLGLLGRLHNIRMPGPALLETAVQHVENTPSTAFLPPVQPVEGFGAPQFGTADFFEDLFVVSTPASQLLVPYQWVQPQVGGLFFALTADERASFVKSLAKIDAMVDEAGDDAVVVQGATAAGGAAGAEPLEDLATNAAAAAQLMSSTLVVAARREQMATLFRSIGSFSAVTNPGTASSAKQPPAKERSVAMAKAVDASLVADLRTPMDDAAFEELYGRTVLPTVRAWIEREHNDRGDQSRRTAASGGARRRNQVLTKDFKRLQCAVMLTEAQKLFIRRETSLVLSVATVLDGIAKRLEAGELAAQHSGAANDANRTGTGISDSVPAPAVPANLADLTVAINNAAPSSREGVFGGFIKLVMSRAVAVREDGERGGTVYSVPEPSLASALEVTGARLSRWQTQISTDIVASSHAVAAMHHARIADLENLLRQAQYERDVDRKAIARRVQAGIADAHYGLLFQNDTLRKENHLLREKAARVEDRIRQEVRTEYEGRMAELQRELLATQGQYRSYQRRLYRGMQASLEEIKRDAMLSVGRMESAPLHMKRQALKIAISDDELNNLRDQNAELRQTVAKTKLWYEMRLLRQKAAYEAKMDDLRRQADEGRTAFWGARELQDRERESLKQQLISAQGSLAQAEIEVDQLRRDLQMQLANKKELVSSKVKQAKAIENLTRRLKKFERFGQHDLDAIVSDYERRQQQQDLQQASGVEAKTTPRDTASTATPRPGTGGSMGTRFGESSVAVEREIKRLRELLTKERSMKEQAFAKVDELRQNNSDASEALVWQRKFYETAAELQRAIKEVESMRAALIQHGVSPPVVSSSSATAAHPLAAPSASVMRGFQAPSLPNPGSSASAGGSRPASRQTPPASRLSSRAGGSAGAMSKSRK